MTTFVIGLGANWGRPQATFTEAAAQISDFARLLRGSRLYRSPPHGYAQQPDFTNAAIAVASSLSPTKLLQQLATVERRLGRRRRRASGPRVIDLDLLWGEGEILTRQDARLPHPRLLQRAFALVPLLEVVPEAADPISGRPYTRWLAEVAAQPLYAVAGSEDWLLKRGDAL